jgi:hypothetical protein
MIFGLENLNLLKIINEFSKVSEYKISMKNKLYVYTLSMNNLKLKSKKKTLTSIKTNKILTNLIRKNGFCAMKTLHTKTLMKK